MNSLTHFLVKNSFLLIVVLLYSCSKRPQAASETIVPPLRISQGVNGKVLFKEGRFASTGEIADNGKVYGIERQILFYEPTSLKDVEVGEGDFIKYNSAELLDSATSDKHGNFSKQLPAGRYSIFIKEAERLYSKLDDDDYYIPVTIVKDSTIHLIVEVDYKATYISGK